MEHDNSRLETPTGSDSGSLALSARMTDDMPMTPAAMPALTLAELPPVNTTRWVTRRKAAVVAAVREGLITLEDACRRYQLSVEEFTSWQRLVDRHGLPGLRATRIQDYRRPDGSND